MLKRARVPRHSTVVAYLALFLALAGGSFAAGAIVAKKPKGGKATVRSTTVTLANPSCQTLGQGQFCSYPETKVTARCKKGEHATGGGFEGFQEGSLTSTTGPRRFAGEGRLNRPEPTKGTPTGWTVEVVGSASNDNGPPPPAPTAIVYAICER